ncbi:MAG: hypothetical protein LC637_09845 [Xanthomonadaceae bacterium]|nr:hypothetical protein [Xanthomonadaceae bacterium]
MAALKIAISLFKKLARPQNLWAHREDISSRHIQRKRAENLAQSGFSAAGQR